MSLAARTREATREHPFLFDALRAEVLNYTAAARFLDVDGDEDAVATALRRYADELPEYECERRDARVTMQRGVGVVDDLDESAEILLRTGGVGVVPDGNCTAIAATGTVSAGDVGPACRRLGVAEIPIVAAAGVDGRLTVVVEGSDAVDALRTVESALGDVPESPAGVER